LVSKVRINDDSNIMTRPDIEKAIIVKNTSKRETATVFVDFSSSPMGFGRLTHTYCVTFQKNLVLESREWGLSTITIASKNTLRYYVKTVEDYWSTYAIKTKTKQREWTMKKVIIIIFFYNAAQLSIFWRPEPA